MTSPETRRSSTSVCTAPYFLDADLRYAALGIGSMQNRGAAGVASEMVSG